MQQSKKKGFTLIELLVVIAIIGILSAIGLVSLNGAREKARDAQRKSDLAQISTAMNLYYDDNNSTYVGSTASQSQAVGTVLQAPIVTTGGYLNTMPLAPGTGCTGGVNTYNYAANATTSATNFALWARMEGQKCVKMFVLNSLGFGGEYTYTATPTLANTGCGGTPTIQICTAAGGAPTG